MLPPSNASLLLRNRDNSIWSRLTPSGFVWAAILPRVSPETTAREFPPAGSAVFARGCSRAGIADGAGLSATARLSAGMAAESVFSAGFAIAGSDRTSGAATGAGVAFGARPAGSSRKVYSRTSRPEAQLNSTSTSMNGSFKGRSLLNSRYRRPPRSFMSRENRRVANAGE